MRAHTRTHARTPTHSRLLRFTKSDKFLVLIFKNSTQLRLATVVHIKFIYLAMAAMAVVATATGNPYACVDMEYTHTPCLVKKIHKISYATHKFPAYIASGAIQLSAREPIIRSTSLIRSAALFSFSLTERSQPNEDREEKKIATGHS